MTEKYFPPQYKESSFTCPLCGVFSNQKWNVNLFGGTFKLVVNSAGMPINVPVDNISIATCDHCNEYSIWYEKEMIYPNLSNAPLPSTDLPIECMSDYNEAREILNKSPRSASALLRLVMQKLCINLGGKGINLNADIGLLVQNGLPSRVQESLDAVRLIGNNSVHPGQIDLNDNPQIALGLFNLVNFVVEKMITEPKNIDAIYNILPESSKTAIDKRDKK